MTVKGKRARITSDGRAHIVTRALEHPRIQRTELARKLQNELEAMGHDMPQLEVLERMISEFRNTPSNPLDKPWSVITLAEHDIPPEALPKVLEIFIDKLKSEGVHLTIREARWIARLSFVLKDTEMLYGYALEYAGVEKAGQLLGVDVFQLTDDIGLYGDMTGEWLNIDDINLVKLHWQREARKISKGGKR